MYGLDYKDYAPFLLEGNRATQVQPDEMVPTDQLRMLPNAPNSDPSDPASGWQMVAEAAQASSAFPVAFPYRYQKRNLEAYAGYRDFQRAIEPSGQKSVDGDGTQPAGNVSQAPGELEVRAADPTLHQQSELPREALMQIVDGGLFNNEPIGRAIDAVAFVNKRYPDRDPKNPANNRMVGRSFLMIEPEPQLPQSVAAALSAPRPTSAVLPPTILLKIIGAYFNNALYSDFKTANETNAALLTMQNVLDKVNALPVEEAERNQLKQDILQASRLEGKEIVTLERIPQDPATSERLACAFGNAFGGFLRRDYRVADFITGKHEARLWLVAWLTSWLKIHATDVGLTGSSDDEIKAFVIEQLGAPPLAPEDAHIDVNGDLNETGLTPIELTKAAWFPAKNATELEQSAALTEAQRREIVKTAEARTHQLLDAWLHPNWLGDVVLDKAVDWWLENKYIKAPK